MIQKFKILGLSFVTAAGLVSCGGEVSDPLDDNSTTQVLNLLVANGGVLSGLPQGNATPNLPMAGVSPASNKLEVKVVGCDTNTSSGDADNDGYDLLKTYTFDCSGVVDGTTQYTQKGTVIFKDLDDSVKGLAGGLRVEYNVPIYDSVDLKSGTAYSSQYLGFYEYKKEGSSYVSTSDFSGKNKYKYGANGENDYVYTSTWDWTMTPDDATDETTTWTAGKIEFEGTFKLKGKFINEIDGVHTQGEGEFSIKYYSQNLTYDSNCGGGKWYRNGALVMEDTNGTKIEVRYAECAAKLYVNGMESDLWTP